jgi:putative CocE/NonD family hydrolase
VIDRDKPPAGRSAPAGGEPAPTRMLLDLLVPMRDGVALALDVVLPEGRGPFPVVLERTPYDKVLAREWSKDLVRILVAAGYAVAFNDCRGRFNSDGRFDPYFQEMADGADTVNWVGEQGWCDGRIGMIGASYGGQTQWWSATGGSGYLKALVPFVSPPASLWDNEPIRGGCLLLDSPEWGVGMGRRSFLAGDFLERFSHEHRTYKETLPIRDLPAAAGVSLPWLDAMLDNPRMGPFWKRADYGAWEQILAPALSVTGWWDMNFPGAITNFPAMRAHGGSEVARRAQRLVIGPWAHRVNRERSLNGYDFGDDAVIDLDGHALRYLDHHVRGIDNGVDRDPAVSVFVIGANEWWACDDWPLREAVERPLYLRSDGHANTLLGDGRLSWDAPGAEPEDRYDYDPLDPVRHLASIDDGPKDDRVPSTRADVLSYTTEPLERPVDVVGPVRLALWASSSALDTDWHVRLVDVAPDGTAHYLCHGALRARYRESFERPELLRPGAVEEYEIGMDAVGVRFRAGHRIRLEVTSSWFPRYDRNTNTGADNPFADGATVVARQAVFHDRAQPSHLVLPVVE